METKLVYFKNGDYIVVSDGVTWEYENDADWCKTVSIQKLIKKSTAVGQYHTSNGI